MWVVLVAVLSLLPGRSIDGVPVEIPHIDKAVHFLFYGIMTFLLGKYLQSRRHKNQLESQHKKQQIVGVLACMVYGTILEFVQEFAIPGRNYESWDILFNIAGAIAGIALFNLADKNN